MANIIFKTLAGGPEQVQPQSGPGCAIIDQNMAVVILKECVPMFPAEIPVKAGRIISTREDQAFHKNDCGPSYVLKGDGYTAFPDFHGVIPFIQVEHVPEII